MLYRCRHRKCYQRRALKRNIESYVRKPKCRACGGELILDKSWAKLRRKKVCQCSNVPWPHQIKSWGCIHKDKGFESEEEYRDYLEQLQRGTKQ